MFLKKCNPFYPMKKYVQFNDLVIDNHDMLQEAQLSGGFKHATQEYSYGNGSYLGAKRLQQFSKEQSLSLTLKLDTRKLQREQQKFYKDWVYMNLAKIGKLWAIQGDQLLWANALVDSFSEAYQLEKFVVSIDVELILYEGVWHKANPRKTFLEEYSSCNFMDCLDFREVDECLECCVACAMPHHQVCKACICDCDFLTAEHSLCELKPEIATQFYSQCGDSYRIIYNCEAGKKIWGEKMLGEKICKEEIENTIIAGQFYSSTVLESDNVTVTLVGTMKDPEIKINGNAMRILGCYDGKLTILPSGDIYYLNDPLCQETVIEPDNLVIPTGNTFGFTVHQGLNSLVVETDDCCSMVCAYIEADRITM